MNKYEWYFNIYARVRKRTENITKMLFIYVYICKLWQFEIN